MSTADEETAHFGFKEVIKTEKEQMVRNVFNSVSSKYDIMNDLMSLGIHRLWKNALINWLSPQAHYTLLDVAGGTGDIAFRYKKMGGGFTIVCDINDKMLEKGRQKLAKDKYAADINWICGDAEGLPFPDRSFDVYTIAFGLRNVTNISKALQEAQRVLRPGGRFLCLEFSRLAVSAIKPLYDSYSFKILPEIGSFVANDREAYVYLAESIRKFPNQRNLIGLMKEAGLERAKYRNLSGGVAAIHSAWRL
ncbi:MAG: bifunctional demethylmenaquinone methyltransferase/2-methoxy-6-polyprenyl-1,4-benzoquinol methylase UbiE [Rhodospirillaceae bacterium]|nr:bifunctional demethylmenaquinone methyltransferase/2-methoxy-6-polyprenyl-1,4-benzoquinol methylase UbiE [Rhodospirillaceae bacterium]